VTASPNIIERDPVLDRRQHVQPTTASDDATWRAIEERLDAPKRRTPVVVGTVLAAAAAVLLVFVLQDDAPARWAGTTLTAAAEPVAATLEDGSEIVAAPESHLERVAARSEDELRIALRRGSATFEVARDPSRTFVVQAEDVEVRVIGTRFSVSRRGDEVDVYVERGSVDVRVGEETRRLRPGQSWSGAAREPVAAVEPVVFEDAPEAEEPEVTMRRRRSRPSATELFDAARAARRDGEPSRAAEAYDRFLRAYPGNPRAGIAAIELGRLRMDRLGDPAGAARAFERALRLGAGGLREDVMARLVRAHRAAGHGSACARARDAYLGRYPEGRHADDVRDGCGRH